MEAWPTPSAPQVRIPAHCLTHNNRQVRARQLWGSDIYTDDSDLVVVLMHAGYLYHSRKDAAELLPCWVMLKSTKYLGTCPPPTSKWKRHQPPHLFTHLPFCAVHHPPALVSEVRVVVVPREPLPYYTSTARNSIRSRSWGASTDGCSYSVGGTV
jgi:hypothetical protein